MQKGFGVYWRRLGRLDKTFLFLLLAYVALYVSAISPLVQSMVGLVAFCVGLLCAFRLARRGMRKAIWRLRNRLIAAYLFIAVVPIILILTLVGMAGWAVIGQIAVYLVNTQLSQHEMNLMRQARGLARFPLRDPEGGLNRVAMNTRDTFPVFEMLITGQRDLHYPADSQLTHLPAAWKDEEPPGLILKSDGKQDHLYACAHVQDNGEEVTVLAPLTQSLLSGLVTGLGNVNFVPVRDSKFVLAGGPSHESHIPEPRNLFDMRLRGFYLLSVPMWESPRNKRELILTVDTRISSVLGTIFQKLDWAETAMGIFLVVAVLFFLVEMASLVAGIQLSRSITGAVHELYEGMQHVKDGDFSYRVPVKGSDQLAELTHSFNTMSGNLGRLLVVAKEKERLESELTIAREVQSQLFPKDVPFTKTLELKGVCNPARMVSGDYYDFMPISESSLAFAIGDVAGKGISAALLMATIQSTMRTQLSTTNGTRALSAAYMVSNLNRQLYATTAPEKYATFYFALYEESTHTLTYTNAGHLAPILIRGGTMQMLESTGTVVGAFPFANYEEKSVTLEHGDILVAYTDGIVEPENVYGEMFGEERLLDLILKHAREDSSEMIARTMESVVQWTGSTELQDDMTMVVARRI